MKKNRLAYLLSILILVCIAVGMACIIFVPRLALRLVAVVAIGMIPTPALHIALYWGGACGLWLLTELYFMMRRIIRGISFKLSSVKTLKRIGICCGILALDAGFLLTFSMSLAIIMLVVMLIVVMLCAFVFAGLFRQAVEYKQENDLTI